MPPFSFQTLSYPTTKAPYPRRTIVTTYLPASSLKSHPAHLLQESQGNQTNTQRNLAGQSGVLVLLVHLTGPIKLLNVNSLTLKMTLTWQSLTHLLSRAVHPHRNSKLPNEEKSLRHPLTMKQAAATIATNQSLLHSRQNGHHLSPLTVEMSAKMQIQMMVLIVSIMSQEVMHKLLTMTKL